MTDHMKLPHTHLTTLELTIDPTAMENIGEFVPSGVRKIVPVLSGTFAGKKLTGHVNSEGADWVIFRPDGSMLIDVRVTLKTDDDVLIYLTYQGRFLPGSEDYSLVITPKFECGHPKYKWLNDVIAVGVGKSIPKGPIYTIYEIR